jgi:hypothetical protein
MIDFVFNGNILFIKFNLKLNITSNKSNLFRLKKGQFQCKMQKCPVKHSCKLTVNYDFVNTANEFI